MTEQDAKRDDAPRHLRKADRVFALAENVVYGGIAVLLVVTALVLLVQAAGQLLSIRNTPVQDVTIEVLDTLLLVFIVVELLFAVRATVVKRELVAEPFLLVGIIASIKEIVLLIGAEDLTSEQWEAFRNGLVEVGVLTLVILVLTVCTLLARRRLREPDEEEVNEAGA